MQSLPPALLPLGAWPQFVCWFAAPHPTKLGKFNKFPCDWQTGAVIDAHDPQYWTSAVCALAMAETWNRGHGCGAGFVFTDADPFFFHDIDGAWNGREWSALALSLLARLDGCAVEVSHSGAGLHVIGRTAALAHGTKNTPLGLELYTSKRFVALTGTHARGDAAHDATIPLAAIAADYFPESGGAIWEGWTTEPVAEYTGPADDDALIRKALASSTRNAAAAFGASTQPTFADLWEARPDALAAWRPQADAPGGFGRTEADQALANMLAFWTGKNCERIETLMRRSALTRDKWDVHRTYLADTILKACGFVEKVYTLADTPAAPLVAAVPAEQMEATAQATGRKLRDPLREYMGPHDQLTHFDGCYYDNATEKVYSLGRNTVFSKSAFDINFGGHIFIMDPTSQKTSPSAWECYTQSRVNVPVIVDGLCFRPEHASGALVRDGTRVYANSYVPHTPRTVEGDPGKFLTHLAKLLPIEDDRARLLAYLASMAQNPGRKFQWWPVIQGAEGNGKTILIAAMSYVLGEHYSHLPNAHAMARDGNKFNGWIYRKLFIGIEELCLSSKRDFLDEFKTVVTNERIPLEKKGADQFTGDNRVNGIICTNHKDGVPITVDTRRYGIFYTAQQSEADISRDGMTSAYFADLWDWFKGRGAYAEAGENYGAACIAHYLRGYAIPAEMDPAGLATRAPKTSSTAEALIASLGRAEQEILDAVDEGRPGFAGGWVSSFYLDVLLDQIKAAVPRNKRRQMMQQLGYDFHPALRDGRTNDVTMPDARKPRLYVKAGHLSLNVDQPAEVARLYSKAQEPASANVAPSPAAIAFAKPGA